MNEALDELLISKVAIRPVCCPLSVDDRVNVKRAGVGVGVDRGMSTRVGLGMVEGVGDGMVSTRRWGTGVGVGAVVVMIVRARSGTDVGAGVITIRDAADTDFGTHRENKTISTLRTTCIYSLSSAYSFYPKKVKNCIVVI
jgi:hypothetical protein